MLIKLVWDWSYDPAEERARNATEVLANYAFLNWGRLGRAAEVHDRSDKAGNRRGKDCRGWNSTHKIKKHAAAEVEAKMPGENSEEPVASRSPQRA